MSAALSHRDAPRPVTRETPSVRERLIRALWNTGVQDTVDISEAVGMPEADVVRILRRKRELRLPSKGGCD